MPRPSDRPTRSAAQSFGTRQCPEERRFASRSVYRCFDACAWVHLTAIREVLGLLYEVGFAEVPLSVQDVLRADFEGWGTSSVVENAFRAARALERASPSHRLAPHRVWQKPHEDGVLAVRPARD